MPYQRLKVAKEKVIGTKQTLKAIKNNAVKVVYVAKDAEKHVVKPVLEVCEQGQVPLVQVDSMHQLGLASGIKVGCATAAIVKD